VYDLGLRNVPPPKPIFSSLSPDSGVFGRARALSLSFLPCSLLSLATDRCVYLLPCLVFFIRTCVSICFYAFFFPSSDPALSSPCSLPTLLSPFTLLSPLPGYGRVLAEFRNLDPQILLEVVALVENEVWCVWKWVWVERKNARTHTSIDTRACTHGCIHGYTYMHTQILSHTQTHKRSHMHKCAHVYSLEQERVGAVSDTLWRRMQGSVV
jgi:hypothetical protein